MPFRWRSVVPSFGITRILRRRMNTLQVASVSTRLSPGAPRIHLMESRWWEFRESFRLEEYQE